MPRDELWSTRFLYEHRGAPTQDVGTYNIFDTIQDPPIPNDRQEPRHLEVSLVAQNEGFVDVVTVPERLHLSA